MEGGPHAQELKKAQANRVKEDCIGIALAVTLLTYLVLENYIACCVLHLISKSNNKSMSAEHHFSLNKPKKGVTVDASVKGT